MFTDIVGFSRQMGDDEAHTLQLLGIHNQLIQQAVAAHNGAIIIGTLLTPGKVCLLWWALAAFSPSEAVKLGFFWVILIQRLVSPHILRPSLTKYRYSGLHLNEETE
jgi:hypothetical protein